MIGGVPVQPTILSFDWSDSSLSELNYGPNYVAIIAVLQEIISLMKFIIMNHNIIDKVRRLPLRN
jgi:hypothetical protein